MSNIIIELSPNFHLGYDELQWILLRSSAKAQPSAIAYIATTKTVLKRILKEYNVKLSFESKLFLSELPEKFKDFIASK